MANMDAIAVFMGADMFSRLDRRLSVPATTGEKKVV